VVDTLATHELSESSRPRAIAPPSTFTDAEAMVSAAPGG
jgi:hypothetical protein